MNFSRSTYVLSPHSDDAALSLGAAILSRRFFERLTVITVFGRSNYAHGRFHSDAEYVTALRRLEDEAWARDAQIELISLDRREASLRLGSSFEAVFGAPDFAEAGEIACEIHDLTRMRGPCLVLAPLGVGGHCDHVLAREIACRLARLPDVAVAFYEDLPYVERASPENIQKALRQACLREPFSIELTFERGALDAKCASLLLYATQVDGEVVDAVRRHGLKFANGRGAERIWFERERAGALTP